MINVFLLVLYSAAAGVAAWSLVRLLFNDRPAWWRGVVSVAMVPVLITVVLTALGLLGGLHPHTPGIVMVVAAAGLWIAGRTKVVAAEPVLFSEPVSREAVLGLAALVGVLLPAVGRALLTGPQFGYDDYSYHAPFVTQWMLDGRISLLAFNYHAYFPFNAELFSLWFMLPIGADTYVGFSGAFWSAAAAASVTALALSIGRRAEAAMLAAALVCVSSLVLITALRFSANDLAPTVMIASALMALGGSGRGRRASDVVVAGAFIGFGLGAKLTMLPAVAVLAAWIALDAKGGVKLSTRLVHLSLFALGGLAVTGYWYGRNWVLTGNPFFPGAIGPFPGPLGPAEQEQTKLITHLLTDPVGTARIALAALTDWPVPLWIVAAAGYVGGLAVVVRKQREQLPANRVLEAVLLLVGVSLLLAFPFQPFSATKNLPGAPITPEPRFLIISYMAGIVLASRWITGLRGVLGAGLIVAVGGFIGNLPAGIAAAVLMAAAWAAPAQIGRVLSFLRLHRTAAWGAAVIILAVGAVVWRGNLEGSIQDRVFSYRSAGQPLGPVWEKVNALPAGSKVVAFGLAGNFSYPLFGRSLAVRPVMLGRAGGPLQPVHALYLADPEKFVWWAEVPDSSELATLASNLLSKDVTHVAVTRTAAGEWPVQTRILLPPDFTVLSSDPGWALFRVNR
jgi:hypothetical protein